MESESRDANPPQSTRLLIGVLYATLGCLLLYFGRDLLIPLAFASLISFVLYPICTWLERRGFSTIAAIAVSLTLLMLLGLSVVALLVKQFVDFANEWPALQRKFGVTIQQLSVFIGDSFNITREQQLQWISKAMDRAVEGLLPFITGTISFSAVSMVMLVLIPVYVALILFYRRLWMEVLYQVFSGEKDSIRQIISLSVTGYYNFIKGMGLVYLAVGLLNSIGLLLLGVPHAFFFGFVASVLTFIPYVGIVVGSLLPITMAWLTYDSVWYPIGVILIFSFVQYLEANLIFPFAVSNRLKVNTLAMLLAIFTGGLLWGVAGMILFVPFVGILKLVADHHPRLKTISMALGTGK